ncbi:hypothetical protein [Aurantimonas sp. Leaf443]|uniref:hypothetical protein n=1 Tax=Aurantimonas sp. Leaf443 TaxID=1736378 RepID=UPI0006F83291|nr:hypothetical protein [Aurantimonas sp. Leaf443]KQT86592.1 hypothetical protein ASG48_17750 [Aurantimonas sp. Leaf443]
MTAKTMTRLRDTALAAAAFLTVLAFVLLPLRPQGPATPRSQTVHALAPTAPEPRLAARIPAEPDLPVR